PPFAYQTHVKTVRPTKESSGFAPGMVRGWDFGFHKPAVGWHQLRRCASRRLHWAVLDEYCGANLEAEDLAKLVISRSKERFPEAIQWADIGDAAGAALSDKGPGPIVRLLHPPYRLTFRYRRVPNIDPGLAFVRELLSQAPCACGLPTVVVHPRCAVHIEALSGGYHYPAQRYGREEKSKPVKDGHYDNPMDEMRYVAELAYRPASLDPNMLARLMEYTHPRAQWQAPSGEPLAEFRYTQDMARKDLVAMRELGLTH
ncbi:MAG: hypothetical protein ACRDGM_04430, partial [bacterium]